MRKPRQSDHVNTLLSRVSKQWPVGDWVRAVVVVAVSGGPDSVALLQALAMLRTKAREQADADDGGNGGNVDKADGAAGNQEDSGELIVWHYNHQTRPESDRDEQFVAKLAGDLGLRFEASRRQVEPRSADGEGEGARGGNSNHLSEESLRSVRYESLLKSAQQFGARYVVTGHNKDDQVETILFRLFRGTGIGGLVGIPPVRVHEGISIVRPLLSTTRAEIIAFLVRVRQSFQVDGSNADSRYARNFLRNELLPTLRGRFGDHLPDAILRLSAQAEDFTELLDQLTEPLLAGAETSPDRGVAKLPIAGLRTTHSVVRIHLLRRLWRQTRFPEQGMSGEKWQQLDRLAALQDSAPIQLPGSIIAKLQGNSLFIERI